jgi:hypothetical protein
MAFVNLTFLPFYFFTFLPLHHATSSSTEDEGDDVTDRLKDCLNRLVHNCHVLNGELLGLFISATIVQGD